MWLLLYASGIRLSNHAAEHTAPNCADDSEEIDTSAVLPSQKTVAAAKDKYAHTLFYLAQIFANVDDPRMGAFYCGETLALQLEMGESLE